MSGDERERFDRELIMITNTCLWTLGEGFACACTIAGKKTYCKKKKSYHYTSGSILHQPLVRILNPCTVKSPSPTASVGKAVTAGWFHTLPKEMKEVKIWYLET